MVLSGNELLHQVGGLYDMLDDGVDEESVQQAISDHLKDLDEHVVHKSKELEQVRVDFLNEPVDRYTVEDYYGYHPLMEQDEPLPVSSKGVVAYSLLDVHDSAEEMWSRLGSLDSIEALNEYRDTYIDRYGEAESQDLVDGLVVSNSQYLSEEHLKDFDNFDIDRVQSIAKSYEFDSSERVDVLGVEYQEFLVQNQTEHSEDAHATYLGQLMGPRKDYGDTVLSVTSDEDLLYNQLENSDFTRSSLIKKKNYEQLLFGLYDQDKQAVDQSGLKDEFVEAVDTYFILEGKSMSDLYDRSDSYNIIMDDLETIDALHGITMQMGFTDHESRGIVDLLDYEERMYIEHGQAYASRGGDLEVEPGDRDSRFKWLPEGFEHVYGYSMDYNSRQLRTQYELGDTDGDIFTNSETAGKLKRIQELNTTKLMDVNLQKRMSPDFATSKEDLSVLQDVGFMINQIANQQVELDEDIRHVFKEQVEDTMKQWDYTEDELTNDPELFVDWLAESTNRTLSELDPAMGLTNDGYTIIAMELGHNLEPEDVSEFFEGIALNYPDINLDPVRDDGAGGGGDSGPEGEATLDELIDENENHENSLEEQIRIAAGVQTYNHMREQEREEEEENEDDYDLEL